MVFLRSYADCPVPEGLALVIELALDVAGGRFTVGELADHAARAADLDRRVCASANSAVGLATGLFVDLSTGPTGLRSIVSRGL